MDLIRGLKGVDICSDKPFSDAYEPKNLINGSNKGFMAERFLRPPITLTVKFPCSVSLQSIRIGNTIGSHSSSSFQILSYCLHPGKSVDVDPVFMPVGQGFDVPTDFIAYFINKLYRGKTEAEFSHIDTPVSTVVFPLSSFNRNLLNSCRQLAIRIVRCTGSSIPAIGSLEITGHPCKPFNPNILAQPRTQSANESVSIGLLEASVTEQGNSPNTSHLTTNDCIPDEFLDPITCEPMAHPIILPSGYTIDQSTLDRHIESGRSFGRKPCDPYTGVIFNNSVKPVVNDKLKERIDRHFLSGRIPRLTGQTVGRKRLCVAIENELATKVIRKSEVPTDLRSQTEPISTEPFRPSLSEQITLLLQNTPSLRSITLPVAERCCKCQDANPSNAFYKLICRHLVCTKCLTKSLLLTAPGLSCPSCNEPSNKCDITRHFI